MSKRFRTETFPTKELRDAFVTYHRQPQGREAKYTELPPVPAHDVVRELRRLVPDLGPPSDLFLRIGTTQVDKPDEEAFSVTF